MNREDILEDMMEILDCADEEDSIGVHNRLEEYNNYLNDNNAGSFAVHKLINEIFTDEQVSDIIGHVMKGSGQKNLREVYK